MVEAHIVGCLQLHILLVSKCHNDSHNNYITELQIAADG